MNVSGSTSPRHSPVSPPAEKSGGSLMEGAKKAKEGVLKAVKDFLDNNTAVTAVIIVGVATALFLQIAGFVTLPHIGIREMVVLMGVAGIAWKVYGAKEDSPKLFKVIFPILITILALGMASFIGGSAHLGDFSSYMPIAANVLAMGGMALGLAIFARHFDIFKKLAPGMGSWLGKNSNKVLAAFATVCFFLAASCFIGHTFLGVAKIDPVAVVSTSLATLFLGVTFVGPKLEELWKTDPNIKYRPKDAHKGLIGCALKA